MAYFSQPSLLLAIAAAIVIIIMLLDAARYKKVYYGSREWSVAAGYDNASDAAALLDNVHKKLINFMRILKDKYHIDEPDDIAASHSHGGYTWMQRPGVTYKSDVPYSQDKFKIIDTLLNNYNPDTIGEHIPLTNETTYTRNKGESMHVCLRDKTNPSKLVPEDTLLFVLLHEISHIAAYNTWGHTTRFWEVFKFILREAVASGIYRPVNYATHNEMYCGLNLTHNPLYDPTIMDIQ
jgi:hypothetical protein